MAENMKGIGDPSTLRLERKPNWDILQMMRGLASDLLQAKLPSEEDEKFADELINECRSTPLES